jgi:hypothetical protein
MRGQRRPVLYLILISVIIGVAVVAYRSFPSSGQTEHDLGQLALALQNYSTGAKGCGGTQAGCKDPTNVISARTDHPAVIDGVGQGVTWYDVSGYKIHTQVRQRSDIPNLFSQHSFFNYKTDASGASLW